MNKQSFSTNKITVSAPGKLMLFGEHAVVYDRPCIVTAVSSRIRVTIGRTPGRFVIDAPQVKDVRFVEEAVGLFQKKFKVGNGLTIKTESDFSCQYGFGSSSAVTVATLLALSKIFGKFLTKKEIFDLGYKTTLNIQGLGSGFDVAAAVYGGTVYFFTGGKVIEPLHIDSLPIIVGYSGIKADTPTMVKKLKRKMKKAKMFALFDEIEKIVEEAKKQLLRKNWQAVGALMNENHKILKELGVSTKMLDEMCAAAVNSGAYGAKLSGAGGGDCMIALVSRQKRKMVERAIKKVGGQVIDVSPNAEGAQVETTDNPEELFVVVDKNDRVIGYRTRYDCHHNKILIHRGVNLLIFDDKGRVLLQRRSLSKDTFPGYWSTSVGGHVIKGESYKESLCRETKEELGADLPVTFHSKFIFFYPHETEMETLFLAKSNGPFNPDPSEVDYVEFMSKKELSEKILSGKMKLTALASHALKLIGFLS